VGLKIANEWKAFHLLFALQCFIREGEEEELFLVFGILFNLNLESRSQPFSTCRLQSREAQRNAWANGRM